MTTSYYGMVDKMQKLSKQIVQIRNMTRQNEEKNHKLIEQK